MESFGDGIPCHQQEKRTIERKGIQKGLKSIRREEPNFHQYHGPRKNLGGGKDDILTMTGLKKEQLGRLWQDKAIKSILETTIISLIIKKWLFQTECCLTHNQNLFFFTDSNVIFSVIFFAIIHKICLTQYSVHVNNTVLTKSQHIIESEHNLETLYVCRSLCFRDLPIAFLQTVEYQVSFSCVKIHHDLERRKRYMCVTELKEALKIIIHSQEETQNPKV